MGEGKVKDNEDTKSMSSQIYTQIPEHLKNKKQWPLFPGEGKVETGPENFQKGAVGWSLEPGNWSTFTSLWFDVISCTVNRLGQMTLKVHDSMQLSWILHLVGTLYKRLVKVLLILMKDYSTIKCYKDEDSLDSWTPYCTKEETEAQSDKVLCSKSQSLLGTELCPESRPCNSMPWLLHKALKLVFEVSEDPNSGYLLLCNNP